MKWQRIRDKSICYLLLLLLIVYHSQGVVLPEEGAVGQILIAIIFIFSFIYLIKMLLLKKKFTSFMRVWLIFMVMYIVYFLLYDNYAEYSIIKMVLLNFLPFFPFYYFAEKEILTRKLLIAFFLILLPVLIQKFNQSINQLRFEEMKEDVVDNTVYLFIGLLPFVFLFRQKLLSFLFLMIIWFYMIQSAKRAAIICGMVALGLIVFEYLYASKSKSKFKQYFFAIVLLFAIGYFGYDLYEQNQYAIDRMTLMMEGQSSGRDFLIEALTSFWFQSNRLISYLFGFGYNSSSLHSVHVSHNDWVDMLVSFGLMGIVVYFAIFRLLFIQVLQKDGTREKKVILILVICIALITSLTSRWYWSTFVYMQILILPYLLATYNKET